MASKEANRAKYLYNKPYQDAYWERKGKELKEAEKSRKSTRLSSSKSDNKVEVKESDLYKWLLPDLKCTEVTVCRNGQSDEQYIKALETANKTINSENKRLIKLLLDYQSVIKRGLDSIIFETKNCN